MAIIVKDWRQIEGIRKSCRLAATTLKYIEPFVVEGVTTGELDSLIDKYIRDNGGTSATLHYRGYPKSSCISLNEVICHGIPGDRVLCKGDILNIDVSTILDGYYGDTGTMFAINPISEDAQQLLNVAQQCLEIGIKQVKPGNYFGNIGYEIGKYATLQRCSVVMQYTGHGVGIQFHEEPQVEHYVAEKNVGQKMKPGMIFTCEPMICLKSPKAVILNDGWTAVTEDGGLSAQYEHSILVTRKGHEILTA